MTAGESGPPGNGNGNGNGAASSGGDGGRPEALNEITEVQVRYVIENFGDSAQAYPPGWLDDGAGPGPMEFMFHARTLLTREEDLPAVLAVIGRAGGVAPGPEEAARDGIPVTEVTIPIPGLARIELAATGRGHRPDGDLLFRVLETIELELGQDVAGPEHLLSVTPATLCAATEPEPVPPGTPPLPAVSRSRCDGRGVLVAVVDTGLIEEAPAIHPWLQGVTGPRDLQVQEGLSVERYGGHGTFNASGVRTMAPRAEVRVARIFEKAGALFEADVVRALLQVLDWSPDVINLSAGTHTWKNRGLLSFHVFVNGPLRERQDTTVLVAAAGNDGLNWRFSPADMDGVVGVGALGLADARALFSDYGDWVKVFAPGQDLVQAFARGRYEYAETPAKRGEVTEFSGMARWSGTSFAAPLVAGLIAARMSGTGESARAAADSLLRLARAQALPGVGPVLRPGQACLPAGAQCGQPEPERPGRDGPRRHCGCR